MRFPNKMKNIDALLASAALTLLLATILIQVLLRFVFSRPLMGAEEFTRYMVIFVVTAPLAYTERTNSHVVMEELQPFLPAPVRSAVKFLIALGTTAVYAIIAYSAIEVLLNNADNATATLKLPFWLFFLPTTFGFIALTLVRLTDLIRSFRKGR